MPFILRSGAGGLLFQRLYERLAGRPYPTVRAMTVEFGPDAARYAEFLSGYTNRELIDRGPEILAQLREYHAAIERIRYQTRYQP